MNTGGKNVVVVPYGNKSLRSPWLWKKDGRDFDVVLLFYHDDLPEELRHPAPDVLRVFHLKNFKWIMIQDLIKEAAPEIIDQYDYFFFVDDDIEITLADINFLFLCMREYDVQLSQPVLTRQSYKSWRALRRKLLSGVRYVSSVELMCPVMSRPAVKALVDTFALNRSGWGIDILWGKIIREQFGDRSIAVFDTIRATHRNPVGKGELYVKLGKPATEERDEIFSKFKLEESTIYTLPIRPNGFMTRFKSFFRLRNRRERFDSVSQL